MTDVTIGAGLQGATDDGAPALKVRGYWQTVGYRPRYDYVTLFFAGAIALIALAAIFAPLLFPVALGTSAASASLADGPRATGRGSARTATSKSR
jgi:hypothetical protein